MYSTSCLSLVCLNTIMRTSSQLASFSHLFNVFIHFYVGSHLYGFTLIREKVSFTYINSSQGSLAKIGLPVSMASQTRTWSYNFWIPTHLRPSHNWGEFCKQQRKRPHIRLGWKILLVVHLLVVDQSWNCSTTKESKKVQLREKQQKNDNRMFTFRQVHFWLSLPQCSRGTRQKFWHAPQHLPSHLVSPRKEDQI